VKREQCSGRPPWVKAQDRDDRIEFDVVVAREGKSYEQGHGSEERKQEEAGQVVRGEARGQAGEAAKSGTLSPGFRRCRTLRLGDSGGVGRGDRYRWVRVSGRYVGDGKLGPLVSSSQKSPRRSASVLLVTGLTTGPSMCLRWPRGTAVSRRPSRHLSDRRLSMRRLSNPGARNGFRQHFRTRIDTPRSVAQSAPELVCAGLARVQTLHVTDDGG